MESARLEKGGLSVNSGSGDCLAGVPRAVGEQRQRGLLGRCAQYLRLVQYVHVLFVAGVPQQTCFVRGSKRAETRNKPVLWK